MESEAYSYGLSDSTASRRSRLKSQSHFYFDYTEVDGDDDLISEYPCPFCSDDFDLLELCCHIDEDHHVEANSGICPVCSTRVGADMVGHITMQHEDILNSQQRLKVHKNNIRRSLSFERKELQDDHAISIFSEVSTTSYMEPDPLLSFLCNVPVIDEPKTVQPVPLNKEALEEKDLVDTLLDRDAHLWPIPDMNEEEKTQRCDFVRGVVFSTIFDDSS